MRLNDKKLQLFERKHHFLQIFLSWFVYFMWGVNQLIHATATINESSNIRTITAF